MDEAKEKVKKNFEQVFDVEIIPYLVETRHA
jgi:hypothetical protein